MKIKGLKKIGTGVYLIDKYRLVRVSGGWAEEPAFCLPAIEPKWKTLWEACDELSPGCVTC